MMGLPIGNTVIVKVEEAENNLKKVYLENGDEVLLSDRDIKKQVDYAKESLGIKKKGNKPAKRGKKARKAAKKPVKSNRRNAKKRN